MSSYSQGHNSSDIALVASKRQYISEYAQGMYFDARGSSSVTKTYLELKIKIPMGNS